MKIAFFDTHHFDKDMFLETNKRFNFPIEFFETRLNKKTAGLARGHEVVCCFVNDKLDADCIAELKDGGVKLIALRCAGFNQVDLVACDKAGLKVAIVPGYSPYAVAEFTVGLLLSLNRKIHRAYSRVRDHNFSLDGLVGFDLYGKTVGIVGAGKIGKIFAHIMLSFGCQVLIHDPHEDEELKKNPGVKFLSLPDVCRNADVISLNVPLNPKTYHLINKDLFSLMKDGVYIINTGRGALIDSLALIDALKSEKVRGAALDVYEEEESVFFQDLSDKMLKDDVLARLLTFPNVLITSHQAFLTREALSNIATSTLESVQEFENTGVISGGKSVNAECCVRVK